MKTLFVNTTDQWLETYPNGPVVYLMTTNQWEEGFNLAKIGVTTQLPIRHHKLQMQGGRRLNIDHVIPCKSIEEARRLEKSIHGLIGYSHVGEYYWLLFEEITLIRKAQSFSDWVELWHNGVIQSTMWNRRKRSRPGFKIAA